MPSEPRQQDELVVDAQAPQKPAPAPAEKPVPGAVPYWVAQGSRPPQAHR